MWGEDDFDVGKLFVECGDDGVLPDCKVVITPAFDGEGDFFFFGFFHFFFSICITAVSFFAVAAVGNGR